MGPLGWQETVFIFLLALLIFGPKKLPELGRTIGKAMTEFRRASSELKATFEKEMQTLERENESLKQVTQQYNPDTYNYDYSSYDGNYDSYGYDYNNDSTATNPTTTSASATEGAESPAAIPEGTVPYGGETAAVTNGSASQTTGESYAAPPEAPADGTPTTEHKA